MPSRTSAETLPACRAAARPAHPATAILLLVAMAVTLLMPGLAAAQETVRSHGWAIHGDLKYGPDFTHFDYVNPDAPKDGLVVYGVPGTFDSLNPFITSGTPGAGSQTIYDTLMVQSRDEPNSEYGLLAEWIEVEKDADGVFTAIRFGLREEARFHDGEPVRADDVVWTFNTLVEKGAPFYRFYYGNVAAVEALDDLTVEFRLSPGYNKEMPVILGQVPILPKHYWEGRDFTTTTLEPPLGSGPYRISQVRAGQSVTLERVEDYWGADVPVAVGHDNFGQIRYEYFRDRTVMLEALKAGDLDFRAENSAKFWATAYDVPAVEDGRLIQREFSHERGTGMQAFVMNSRKPIFSDVRVREAMTYLWEFEWVNRTIMYDAYTRTDSFYENSELQAEGTPGPLEMEVLEPLRDQLPPRVFTQDYTPPVDDGSGTDRSMRRRAIELLMEAGWVFEDRKLVHSETGAPFEFEILLQQDLFTPHTQALVRNVEKVGGEASIRVVDAAQYRNRLQSFDFDMIIGGWGQSLSPGNEQRDFWTSEAAERPGSRNTAGLSDPAIDALVEKLIASPDRETLVARTRALDRALLYSFPGIPMYHIGVDRFAFWNRFGFPEDPPMQGTVPSIWWVDPELDATLSRSGRE
jgi:microcin C transport system substrate-binding protein